MKRKWIFIRNIYGDEINITNARSIWFWGSGKHFWQYHLCPVLNEHYFLEFIGTKKELKEFLNI